MGKTGCLRNGPDRIVHRRMRLDDRVVQAVPNLTAGSETRPCCRVELRRRRGNAAVKENERRHPIVPPLYFQLVNTTRRQAWAREGCAAAKLLGRPPLVLFLGID